RMKACLRSQHDNMEQNKNFETEMEELVPKREVHHASINCIACQVSCHAGCFLPPADEIKDCTVMDDTGHCVICPGRCHHSDTYPRYEVVKVKKTVTELKDNFVKASSKLMSTKEMLEKIEVDFEVIKDRIMELIRLSSSCLARLEEIALKPNALSTAAYIELLIRNEEEEARPDFEDRIAKLRKMKQHAEILAKIANNEKL
uniref:Uncharacterized protein n=1 Tax=Lepisosteus oculatus TaxID=7918 RepID=W5LWP4_LEPOC